MREGLVGRNDDDAGGLRSVTERPYLFHPRGDARCRRLEGCVHRWSYRLARADGSLSQIAGAAVGGCEDAIEAAVEAGVPKGSEDLTSILDVTTRRKAYASALFHAAQARAGHCAVP